ncbi:putative proteoglycan 4 [Apostichopus japonicus]|uniref:Putative proteoglycan 4 n=1 Tax=Stichopus japonicus TaxID=307972 RepID=A0A2G8JGN2_STIJA|nr:putative proteoglycan 4 [Apostichopus japonicus]
MITIDPQSFIAIEFEQQVGWVSPLTLLYNVLNTATSVRILPDMIDWWHTVLIDPLPYSQEYVIPVTGFFCKLCRKFYNSENSARVIHCKSQAHFTNLKKLYEEMQLAAQITKEVKDPKEESSQEESLKEDSSKDESSEQEECQKEEMAKDTKPESEDKKKETVIKQEDTETVQSVTAVTESKPEEEPLSSKEDADEESKVEK